MRSTCEPRGLTSARAPQGGRRAHVSFIRTEASGGLWRSISLVPAALPDLSMLKQRFIFSYPASTSSSVFWFGCLLSVTDRQRTGTRTLDFEPQRHPLDKVTFLLLSCVFPVAAVTPVWQRKEQGESGCTVSGLLSSSGVKALDPSPLLLPKWFLPMTLYAPHSVPVGFSSDF